MKKQVSPAVVVVVIVVVIAILIGLFFAISGRKHPGMSDERLRELKMQKQQSQPGVLTPEAQMEQKMREMGKTP